MIWKEIHKNNEIFDHVAAIWRHEQALPSWFVSSSNIWTGTLDEFMSFADDCQEIYGLFDDERLAACIYIEKQTDARVIAIHLSVLEKIDTAVFADKLSELRNMMFRRGVKCIRGWTLKKNFGLVRLMTAVGFRGTNFTLAHGEARGRVLKWEMMEVRAV